MVLKDGLEELLVLGQGCHQVGVELFEGLVGRREDGERSFAGNGVLQVNVGQEL